MKQRLEFSLACRRGAGVLLVSSLLSAASAQSFMGFNPSDFSGQAMPAATLKQMVSAAMKNTPPKNGKKYVIGFANLQRDIPFAVLVENSIKKNADAAGIDLVVADNHLSGPTALQVAESFIQRNVDFVIEFQSDANFGAQIMQKMNTAKIPVVAIDIPMGDATFFGANNPYSGFLGGSYLAQAAVAKWGAAKANQAYVVIGELPQSGVVPRMRTEGQEKGIQAVLKTLPADHVIKIDTKNTLEESFKQMSNVLARIPSGAPLLGIGINDQATKGMLQAVKSAGRQTDFLAVGMGADELETLVKEPQFIASVGFYPENYGNYLIPLAMMELSGMKIPQGVLATHSMVTPMNVCKTYPKQPCVDSTPKFTFTFPQAAYNAYVADLRKDPDLKDFPFLLK